MLYQLSYASKFGGKTRRRANLSLRSLPDVRDNYLRYHKGKIGRNLECPGIGLPKTLLLTLLTLGGAIISSLTRSSCE